MVLVERYVRWLDTEDVRGDVMAESRGGKEDMRLKRSFTRVYREGTDFVPPEQFAERLTSKQLKVKQKSNNIVGLQVADLIAHPSYKAFVARRNRKTQPATFGGKIVEILMKNKYCRSPGGKLDGWGCKWLP